MTAMISLVALCALTADVYRQPSWHTNYQAALAQGSRHNRPLAVFLAPGRTGLDKLAADSVFRDEVQQLLKKKFVPVFLNTDTEEGKQLATSFDLPGGVGVVLSNREGTHQTFCHAGNLEQGELVRALEKHADLTGPVVSTESNVVVQNSYYAPTAPIFNPAPYSFQPGLAAGCSH